MAQPHAVTFKTTIFPAPEYADGVARTIGEALPREGSVVVTGGTTAERVYTALGKSDVPWDGLDVLFSDERCVSPSDPASNYGMADRLLFQRRSPRVLHRMRGEDPPDHAAEQYDAAIRPTVDAGIDVALMGMGADAHICALFPGSRALDETTRLCAAVDRPDGMTGLSLTPPAILSARRVFLIVAGKGKAATVARVMRDSDSVAMVPARLLAPHPDVTFLLDEAAASAL